MAGIESMRLSVDMAGIVVSLGSGKVLADNFKRYPLASLASAGAVDVVSGVASLTIGGLRLLSRATEIVRIADIPAWVDRVSRPDVRP